MVNHVAAATKPATALVDLDNLEERILLGMRLPGDGVERVDRLGDRVAVIAPDSQDITIVAEHAVVFAQVVAGNHGAVVVAGPKRLCRCRDGDVGRREVERGAGYANGAPGWEGIAGVLRVGHVEVRGLVAVLRVIGDVDLPLPGLNVVADGDGRMNVVDVCHHARIDLDGWRPGFPAVIGALEEDIRAGGWIAEERAGGVRPSQEDT